MDKHELPTPPHTEIVFVDEDSLAPVSTNVQIRNMSKDIDYWFTRAVAAETKLLETNHPKPFPKPICSNGAGGMLGSAGGGGTTSYEGGGKAPGIAGMTFTYLDGATGKNNQGGASDEGGGGGVYDWRDCESKLSQIINMNATVEVVLTARGANIYNNWRERFKNVPYAKAVAGELITMQLWSLMNTFGSETNIGFAPPFEKCEIKIIHQ